MSLRNRLPLPAAPIFQRGGRFWRGHLLGAEYAWALAFCVPYIAMFLAFIVYPIGFGFWMGSDLQLYRDLFDDPVYIGAAINTALYVGVGVNIKMLLALLLSGLFMRQGWPYKVLLMIFVLPWALPAWPAFMAIHWMLNGEWGFINNFLWIVFGVNGPHWLTRDWLAFGAVMLSYLMEGTTVYDGDAAGRAHGDPPGDRRGGEDRRRHRLAHVRACDVPDDRQPVSRRDAAFDDLRAG